jgi:hypothetical protein
MVHERDDKYEGQEDGEYHFSDDQANYEMEPDAVAHPTEAKGAPAAAKSSGGIEQYKRPLIGVVVFVVLIFLVYKITAPTPTAAPGDFVQNTGTASSAAQKNPSTATAAKVAPAATQQGSAFQPLSQPLGMSSTSSHGVAQPPVVAAVPVPANVQPVAAAVIEQQLHPEAVAEQQPAPALVVQQSAIYNPAHPSDVGNSMVAEPAEIANLNQRISTLTQQNAKMQGDYTQKIADYEAENTALQGKLQDLNMRLASLETTLAHLGRAMQQERPTNANNPNRATSMPGGTPAQVMMQSSSEPKAAYTVQAIIPGRAWLKSEGGETVTVAEGDTLKGYGRIMKIDPYDGVVELDIGGKIVALSYGATGE